MQRMFLFSSLEMAGNIYCRKVLEGKLNVQFSFCAYQHKHSLKPDALHVVSRPGYIFSGGKGGGKAAKAALW